MAFLKFVVVRIAFSAAIYLAVGVGLILSQSPSPPADSPSLDFYELIDGDGDLVVGAKDGAFHAELFEPTLKAATNKGAYLTLPDVGHLGALVDPRAPKAIATFLRAPSSSRLVAD